MCYLYQFDLDNQWKVYEEYNNYNGVHKTMSAFIPRSFPNGESATFKIPSGTISSLKQTFYYDVQKTNSDATITTQTAYGDYSHATSSIAENDAAYNHTVYGAIYLGSSITGYYDAVSSGIVEWYGTW